MTENTKTSIKKFSDEKIYFVATMYPLLAAEYALLVYTKKSGKQDDRTDKKQQMIVLPANNTYTAAAKLRFLMGATPK